MKSLGIADPAISARVMKEWQELTPAPWNARTRPVRLQNGELVVEVSTAAEASVLRYRTGQLLAELDKALGEGTVEVVRLKTARRPF